jgi:hypothetical protein
VSAPIVIDDLATPRFPEHVRAMIDAIGSMGAGLRLELDALMDQAAAETGLTDFGPGDFREPLTIFLTALTTDLSPSPMGRVGLHAQVLQFLKNRLLIEALLARHPEIHDLPIARPIIITGMPRTGTTHLHHLIAADPAIRSLPYWEAIEPVPPPSDTPAAGERDPRQMRTEQALMMQELLMPHFALMHEMTTTHVHEEIHLLAIAGSTQLFDCFAPSPAWRAWYKATDQTPYYTYLKKVLKVLTFLRGGTRWVLKSPQHLEQLRVLARVFPDATLVVTHRDPVSVLASLVTMMAYSARVTYDAIDLRHLGRYWSAVVNDYLHACVAERDCLPAAQSLDVRFADYVGRDLETVERIYARAGQPFGAEVRGALQVFLDEHRRGRLGTIRYDLAPFGINPAAQRAAWRFYGERFGVADEP